MSGIAERLAEVLHVHLCDGTDHAYATKTPTCHMLTQALLPVVEREIAAARGEALREAADAWTQGGWADAMLPKPTHTAAPVIAYSNRMGDWLRNRAALSSDPDRGEGEA